MGQNRERLNYNDVRRITVCVADGARCVYCGQKVLPELDGDTWFTHWLAKKFDEMDDGAIGNIDHIHPFSKGGSNGWENTAWSCWPCNRKKSDKEGWTPRPRTLTNKIITSVLRIIGDDFIEDDFEPPILEDINGN